MTIRAGTLKPQALHDWHLCSNLPHPGEEEYWFNSVAQFGCAGRVITSAESRPACSASGFVHLQRVNPYQSEYSPQVSRIFPRSLAEWLLLLRFIATDIFGELTGEKALEQVIPAERIHDGAVEETLNVPGSAECEGA